MAKRNPKTVKTTQSTAVEPINIQTQGEETMNTAANNNETVETIKTMVTPERNGELTQLSVEEITLPKHILRLNTELSEENGDRKFKSLVSSIKKDNIITPLTVQVQDDGTHLLIDGYRRLKAAEEAGLATVPVIVYKEESQGSVMSLVSNIHRKQLSPIELALAYKRNIDNGVYSTKRELASAIGLSEGTVGTTLNNLKLDTRIIEDLIENNSVKDQKVLKEIRVMDKVDTHTEKSDKQYETYTHITENGLSRKEALVYIQAQRDGTTLEPITKKITNKKISISISKEILTGDQLKKIAVLLEQIEAISRETDLETVA